MSGWDWTEFQNKTFDNPPRPLLLKTLELFGGFTGFAVDLGCGGGTDTVHLVNSGWKALAVDSTPDGFENIRIKLSGEKTADVNFIQADFENMNIPQADLIYSAYGIPFCKKNSFDEFWKKIVNAIRAGGRFAGHLFGEQDGWINFIGDITLKTKPEVYEMLECFNIEYFDELCEDRPSNNVKGIKRWHVFEIIARKKSMGY